MAGGFRREAAERKAALLVRAHFAKARRSGVLRPELAIVGVQLASLGVHVVEPAQRDLHVRDGLAVLVLDAARERGGRPERQIHFDRFVWMEAPLVSVPGPIGRTWLGPI